MRPQPEKSLERRLRDLIGDKADRIMLTMANIAMGIPPPGIEIKAADMIRAAELVLDRTFGKARQVVDLNTLSHTTIDMTGLSLAQLEALAALRDANPEPDDDERRRLETKSAH